MITTPENEQLLLPSTSQSHHEDEQISNDGTDIQILVKQTWLELIRIWQIAGPSIFNRLAMFSLTLIVQSLAGHLGNHYLAAISIVTTVIISITFGFLLGMASALETLCGRDYGARQYQMMGLYLQRSWIVLFLTSIVLLPLFVFATPILKFFGQPKAVADLAGVVAIWIIPMHFSFVFQFTVIRFLQCQLKTGVIALVSSVVLMVHVLICWVFIHRMRVGIVGVTLVLDFSWWLSVLIFFSYSLFGGCPHSWTGFSMGAFDGLWEFFKLSLASGVMLALENFYYRVLIIVSGYYTNDEVAIDALSICMSIFGWQSMIPLGFFAATGVRVANELGAGNNKGAEFATNVSLFNSFLFGLILFSCILAFPEKLATIFTSSISVIEMVSELSGLLAVTILVNCIQPIFSGVAVGYGWQALVAYINIGSYYLIGVPLGIILGSVLKFGFKGIWAGMIGGSVAQTVILATIAIRYKLKKHVNFCFPTAAGIYGHS